MKLQQLRHLLRGPRGRYLIVGVSVYLLELLVIVVAQRLGADSVMAVGLAFWTGLLVSFGLQKLVAFGDKRLHHRVVARQVFLFSLLVLFNFSFTILFTKVLENILPAVVCRTLALGITTIWNFYLYKTHIFSQQPAKKNLRKRQQLVVKKLQRQRITRTYWRWRNTPRLKQLRKLGERPRFGTVYLGICVTLLFATTLLWAGLGAYLQQGNADQLVNAYLFENSQTFKGAALPDQHTFLFKWPLFYLVKLLGYSPAAFISVTVLSVAATVAGFVYVLSRIERRPLALGTLCLLLASVLLLVPPQPYAGGLLPVNMAMLTTRNLEYLLYIVSLVLLVKAPRLHSKQFLGSVILLGVLVASDKLFLSVSVAGALLALVVYALRQHWELATLAVRWLVASAGAVALTFIAFVTLNQAHMIHLVGSTIAGPYGAAHSVHSLGLGAIYGISGLLTNFGANPAYDALTLQHIPAAISRHVLSSAGPAYLLNAVLLGGVLVLSIRFLLWSFHSVRTDQVSLSPAVRLTTLLLWASLAVMGLFVVTDHYYPVDARYLTLCLFAGFVLLATWLRPRRLDAALFLLGAPLLLAVIICGSVASWQTYRTQHQAYAGVAHRNSVIAESLSSHHADILVGDYWRVLPVKSLTPGQQQTVLPLEGCTNPRKVLTSKAWQPDLHKHRVAYLLTFDKGLTDYPSCTLEHVVRTYGSPNKSELIDGTWEHPKELLLFYDQGVHKVLAPPANSPPTTTVLPVSLAEIPHPICTVPTIMNVMAHQDDDLLFMSPDLLHDLDAGFCVRSIFLTAGDAGNGPSYWMLREQGSEMAYSTMLGVEPIWIHRVVRLPSGQFVTIANLRDNDRVSLIFMHLPDGNLRGEGFDASEHQSITGLESGYAESLRTVDGQSHYDAAQLTEGLVALMHTYLPADIRTQSDLKAERYTDHSDHIATGRFVNRAHAEYQSQQYGGYLQVPLRFYLGYPGRELAPNVSAEDLARKQAAFMAYARFDNGVCRTINPCREDAVYAEYLRRQYQNPY